MSGGSLPRAPRLRGAGALLLVALAATTAGCSDSGKPQVAKRPASGGAGGEPGAPGGGGGGAGGGTPVLEVDPYYPAPLAAGVAPTPPMGWNSWNEFGCSASKVTAAQVLAIGDALVDSGMRDAGYEYVNIDDCWLEAARAADGTLQPTAGFPEGLRPVADYLHERGLKLGIYGDRGNTTCAGRAGAEGHEALDADTYVSWGIDYLKFDNCCSGDACTFEESVFRPQYELMGAELTRAAAAADREELVYSICAWWFYEWAVGLGHLWRTTTDIRANFASVMANLVVNRRYAAYAGPNRWNDPDMLEVGVKSAVIADRFTADEERAHFAMWAMMAAPLIAGNDLTEMSDATRSLLTHEEVIAIDQDALGLQGVPVRIEELPDDADGDVQERSVWVKPLNASGARAIALLNASSEPAEMRIAWAEAGLRPGPARVRDVWERAELGWYDEGYATTVGPHAVVLLRVTGSEPPPPSGSPYLSDLAAVYAANARGPVERDQTNGAAAAQDGEPIVLDGTPYDKGLGVAPGSKLIFRLGQRCTRFTAVAGLDDSAASAGSVRFHVLTEGDEELFASDVVTSGSAPVAIDVDVSARHRLVLLVTNGLDGDEGDQAAVWADARLECAE